MILHPFLSQRPQKATGGFTKGAAIKQTQSEILNGGEAGHPHLADCGQFGEQHLEDWRRQRLLENLEQLLRLTAHCDGIDQVVHTFLKLTWSEKKGLIMRRLQTEAPGQCVSGVYRAQTR